MPELREGTDKGWKLLESILTHVQVPEDIADLRMIVGQERPPRAAPAPSSNCSALTEEPASSAHSRGAFAQAKMMAKKSKKIAS